MSTQSVHDRSANRVFAIGEKVRFTLEHLGRFPDTAKRFGGRIGVVTFYRLGAEDPVVEFQRDGRRSYVKLFEVNHRYLEPAPTTE